MYTTTFLTIVFLIAQNNYWIRISTTCVIFLTFLYLSKINIDSIILNKAIFVAGVVRSYLLSGRKSATLDGNVLEIPYYYAEQEYVLRVPYNSRQRVKMGQNVVKIYRAGGVGSPGVSDTRGVDSVETWFQQSGVPFLCSPNELNASKIEVCNLANDEVKTYTGDERIMFF